MPKTRNAKIITGVPDCSTLLTGGWNVPTPAMIDSCEESALRLEHSIAVAIGSLNDLLKQNQGDSLYDFALFSFYVYIKIS